MNGNHTKRANARNEPLSESSPAAFPNFRGTPCWPAAAICKRTWTIGEPRGHADMYGWVVAPPVSPGADIGILFMHNEGYSIIGITKVALETGLLPMSEPETVVKIDSPAGLISAHARVSQGVVQGVYFYNVPSFVLALDETVEAPVWPSITPVVK